MASESKKLTAAPEWKGPNSSIPQQGPRIIIAMIVISLLVHLASYINLDHFAIDRFDPTKKPAPVKVRIVDQPISDPRTKQLVEVPQVKTEKPKDARFSGPQDHVAEKETRVAPNVTRPKGAEAGDFGTSADPRLNKAAQQQKAEPKQDKVMIKPKLQISAADGKTRVESGQAKEPSPYEKLMPKSHELLGQVNAGYQDYIDDSVANGDRIDINTTEFRFMGYFTAMRKSIELVWNYPAEAAQRGMQGQVGLEFVINKDGSVSRIRVIRSSGYAILDKAIVEAIRQAAPFSPLPDSFGKNEMPVGGTFHYVLSSFAGAH